MKKKIIIMIGTDGVKITPLDLDIEMIEKRNMDGISIIAFPVNYPDTEFRKRNYENVMAILKLYVLDEKKYLWVSGFYVFTSRNYKYAKWITEDEFVLTKNLGKRMMCKAIDYIVNEKK